MVDNPDSSIRDLTKQRQENLETDTPLHLKTPLCIDLTFQISVVFNFKLFYPKGQKKKKLFLEFRMVTSILMSYENEPPFRCA